MYKRYKDVVIGGILVALSGIYLMMSFQIKLTNIDRIVGSRMFPQICGFLILILSLYLIVDTVRTAKHKPEEVASEKKNYKKTILVLSSYATYIYLMDKTGFAIASVLYLFSQMILMGRWPVTKRNIALYAVISILSSALIYLLFNEVFMLMLPKPVWR